MNEWLRWAVDALVLPLLAGVFWIVRKVDRHELEMAAMAKDMREHKEEDKEMHERFGSMSVSIGRLQEGQEGMKETLDRIMGILLNGSDGTAR